eukprot:COSAG02_NODE_20000_length_853_cov_0.663130_2_plen_48_part_00
MGVVGVADTLSWARYYGPWPGHVGERPCYVNLGKRAPACLSCAAYRG